MAERLERSFYTTDETLQQALRENDAIAENDPHLEADSSSDESDCESDSSSCTDETIDEDLDTETNFDLDEGLLLEGITDRYYKRTQQMHSTQLQERTGVQQREAELTAVRDRFRSGCGCSLNCFADFSVEEVVEARISLKCLSKAECDMLLLGKLQTFYKPPQEGS